eukprot:360840-Chlamydomonas_euryale.AAC.3
MRTAPESSSCFLKDPLPAYPRACAAPSPSTARSRLTHSRPTPASTALRCTQPSLVSVRGFQVSGFFWVRAVWTQPPKPLFRRHCGVCATELGGYSWVQAGGLLQRHCGVCATELGGCEGVKFQGI